MKQYGFNIGQTKQTKNKNKQYFTQNNNILKHHLLITRYFFFWDLFYDCIALIDLRCDTIGTSKLNKNFLSRLCVSPFCRRKYVNRNQNNKQCRFYAKKCGVCKMYKEIHLETPGQPHHSQTKNNLANRGYICPQFIQANSIVRALDDHRQKQVCVINPRTPEYRLHNNDKNERFLSRFDHLLSQF